MTYILISIPAAWTLWVFYVAVMRLKQVRDAGKLTIAMKVFGYPLLVVGLVLDLLVNVCIGSVVFIEIPRELTLSSRLWRLSNGAPGYRQKVALWFRVNLLDAIDPDGIHHG
jgi:hypothetical protein